MIALYLSAEVGAVALLVVAVGITCHVFGRRIADVEQDLANWLLRDASGWRAREATLARVKGLRAGLEGA